MTEISKIIRLQFAVYYKAHPTGQVRGFPAQDRLPSTIIYHQLPFTKNPLTAVTYENWSDSKLCCFVSKRPNS